MALIDVKNLSFKYGGASHYALKNINITVNAGEFVVLCGESGCGKTTLLRLLKPQISPKGEISGEITYSGKPLGELSEKISACAIGYVMQNPENGIVTDKVWHELAFGLESMGEKSENIRRKVAEICGYFGIGEWYNRRTDELSGGQKQILSLASVMVMNPEVLILDEPTSQLDPVAAREFINTVKNLNQEFGITVILAEHRLEEVFPFADKIALMHKNEMILCSNPKQICADLKSEKWQMISRMLPSSVKIFHETGGVGECPLSVREGRKYLHSTYSNNIKQLKNIGVTNKFTEGRQKVVELSDAYFRYERELPDVLNCLELNIYDNEFICILGANGAGKSTLLNVIAGINRLYRGKFRLQGKKIKEFKGALLYRSNIASLPQNPQLMFTKNTLYEDLNEVSKLLGKNKTASKSDIESVTEKLGISHLLNKHPFDLSGGETQKAGLAKLLMLNPKIILLDEPTKGIDANSKFVLANILASLQAEGKTIIMVTHDVEFAAEHSDRCAMFFDGKIVSIAPPQEFFSDNNYYTTASCRISRGFYENTVTADQVVELCNLNGMKRA